MRNNSATQALTYEERFDLTDRVEWLQANWSISFYISAIYVLVTVLGERAMKNRKRYNLTTPLFIWNALLGVLSAIGAIRGFIILEEVRQKGLVKTACNYSMVQENKTIEFWAYFFMISKVLELGDTVFVFLRKQPMLFLHRYHHVTVLIYSWFAYANHAGTGKIFVLANGIVHSFMYTYFALKTIKVRVPKAVSMVITAGQIFQMIIGCYTNYSVYMALYRGEQCDVTMKNILFSVGMYFSYLVLFSHFFWRAYMSGVSVTTYWKNSRGEEAPLKQD